MSELEGTKAVVVGESRGFGRGIVEALVETGAEVNSAGRRSGVHHDARGNHHGRAGNHALPVKARGSQCRYWTALIMSKIGRYILTTIPPTTTPRNTIIIGSSRL